MKDLIIRLSDEDSPILYIAVIFVLGLAGYVVVKLVDAAVGVCR